MVCRPVSRPYDDLTTQNSRAAATMPLSLSHDLELADDLPEHEDSENQGDPSDAPLPPAPGSIALATSSRRRKRLKADQLPAFVYHDTPIRFLD
jgi:hypothetical protein